MKQGRYLTKEGLAQRVAKQIQKFIEVNCQRQYLLETADKLRIGTWEVQPGMREQMGGRPRFYGSEEHVAGPDLSHFKGLLATRTLVDESMIQGLGS